MAKKQKYLGMEVKRKGNGFFVDCGLLIDAASRKSAQKLLEEFGDMKPIIVLTEKEAHEMLKTLIKLLRPIQFGKKEGKLLEKMAVAFEKDLLKKKR